MKAAYTMGMRPDGRELLVVVIKGTFSFPKSGGEIPELANKQADFVMADEFTGEPGLSAPKYESDFAPFKPRCDVVLNGSAYAPGGEPARRIEVGLRVGGWEKTFNVVGNRFWRKWLCFTWRSRTTPFVHMPISYDNAFGGIDRSQPDEKKHRFYVTNPAGRGYHHYRNKEALDGKPLPNTEKTGQRVRRPGGGYQPMAFGSIGRGWQPRPKFGGTYDQHWLDNVFPFLPADFNDLYYQCAPEDQQIDYLRGGEEVQLVNLTPEGHTEFQLPTIAMPITFYRKNGEEIALPAVNDTFVIEPDLRRFMLTWRAALPLKKNMFEMAEVVVGIMPRAWHRARESGKTWHPSLKDLVDQRAAERAKEAEEPAEELDEVEI